MSHRKPVRSASAKVRTLITESCADAYQPSQSSVKTRNVKPQPEPQPAAPDDGVLQHQDAGQREQGDAEHRDVDRALVPHLLPERPARSATGSAGRLR